MGSYQIGSFKNMYKMETKTYYYATRNGIEFARAETLKELRLKVKAYLEIEGLSWSDIKMYKVTIKQLQK